VSGRRLRLRVLSARVSIEPVYRFFSGAPCYARLCYCASVEGAGAEVTTIRQKTHCNSGWPLLCTQSRHCTQWFTAAHRHMHLINVATTRMAHSIPQRRVPHGFAIIDSWRCNQPHSMHGMALILDQQISVLHTRKHTQADYMCARCLSPSERAGERVAHP
jgi:hypothetical protein